MREDTYNLLQVIITGQDPITPGKRYTSWLKNLRTGPCLEFALPCRLLTFLGKVALEKKVQSRVTHGWTD